MWDIVYSWDNVYLVFENNIFPNKEVHKYVTLKRYSNIFNNVVNYVNHNKSNLRIPKIKQNAWKYLDNWNLQNFQKII